VVVTYLEKQLFHVRYPAAYMYTQICMCLYVSRGIYRTGRYMLLCVLLYAYNVKQGLLYFSRAPGSLLFTGQLALCVQFVDKTYSFAPRAKIMYVNWVETRLKLICTRITNHAPLLFYVKYPTVYVPRYAVWRGVCLYAFIINIFSNFHNRLGRLHAMNTKQYRPRALFYTQRDIINMKLCVSPEHISPGFTCRDNYLIGLTHIACK
jgi:hypothetical protein